MWVKRRYSSLPYLRSLETTVALLPVLKSTTDWCLNILQTPPLGDL